jgi:hypothetical protein
MDLFVKHCRCCLSTLVLSSTDKTSWASSMRLLTKCFAVIVLSIPCHAATAEGEDEKTTLCDLVKNGEKFDGRNVRLLATYQTDLHHFFFLRDVNCSGVTVDDVTPYYETNEESVKNFHKTVWSTGPGQSSTFEIELSGRFQWDRNWQPPALFSGVLKPQPHGLLKIEKVWGFRRVNRL